MLTLSRLRGALAGRRLEFDLIAGLALKGGGAAASVVLSLLISRLYGPDGVGMFQIALTTVGLLTLAATFGLDKVVVRSVAIAWRHGDLGTARASVERALKFTLGLGLALAGFMALMAYPLTHWVMGEPAVLPALLIMALAVPALAVLRVIAGAIRSTGSVVLAQTLDAIIYTGLTGCVLGLAWLVLGDLPLLLPEFLYVAASIGATLYGWHRLSAIMRGWPQGAHSLSLRSGARIAAIYLMGVVVEWVAVIAMSSWGGPAEAGIYRIAAQFGLLFMLVRDSFALMVGPHIAARYAVADHAGMLRILQRSCLIGGGLCLPMLAGLLLFPEFLLGIFGPEFQRGTGVLVVLAIGQFIGVAAGSVGTILDMTHREHVAMRIEIGVMTQSIVLLAWLVPTYGMIGAAITVAMASVTRAGALWIGVLHLLRGMRAKAA